MKSSSIAIILSSILLAGLVFLNTAHASVIYAVDDGSGESSIGSTGSTLIWMNGFQTTAGGETINSVSIAFGSNDNNDPPGDGSAITGYVWSDPTNDGNPFDAVVMSTFTGTVQSSHTDTFINYLLSAPLTFTLGDWFYVGFQSTDFAVSRDTNSDNGSSFVFSNLNSTAIDPNDLANTTTNGLTNDFGFPGNFLIRANATAVNVSTPTNIAILLLGLGGLVALRKRK